MENIFDLYLRKALQLPENGTIPEEKRGLFKARKNSITSEDKIYRENLQTTVKKRYRLEIIEKNNKKSLASMSKDQFITEGLMKLNNFGGEIELKLRTGFLAPSTPVIQLVNYGKAHVYKRGAENPELAALFFKYGIREEGFNEYLDMKPINDDIKIPPVTVKGDEIHESFKGYTLAKMNSNNPLVAIIGRLTSCCQAVGQNFGGETVRHCLTKGGLYVIQRDNDSPTEEDVMAQSWMWRVANIIVADSVESHLNFFAKHQQLIIDMYVNLMIKLCLETDITEGLVGCGGRTPSKLGFFKAVRPILPSDYNGYRDSHSQALIIDKELIAPFIDLYRDKGVKIPAYNLSNFLTISEQGVKKWIDLCVVNNKEDALEYIKPYLNSSGISEETFDDYLSIAQRWMNFLNKLKRPNIIQPDKIIDFINKGVNPNYRFYGNRTLLHLAAKYNNIELVNRLIALGLMLILRMMKNKDL